MVRLFKYVREKFTVKNYHQLFFFLLLVKSLKIIRFSRSTADLLEISSDRSARTFDRTGATQAEALDIYKVFDMVWQANLLHKLNF